jgi:hypothetical protein
MPHTVTAVCFCSRTLGRLLPKSPENPPALYPLMLSTMRFAVRLLVLITTVLGVGVAFAWAWDRSDARAQASASPAAATQAPAEPAN